MDDYKDSITTVFDRVFLAGVENPILFFVCCYKSK